MRIITWNANRVNRWDLLWADPLVTAMQWDVICLQEVGNPNPNWTHVHGPVWQPQASQRDTDEMVVVRTYTYQPPGYVAPLHIVHAEWPRRQKNHLAIITRTPASWATNISGEEGERPALGIKARLNWPHGHAAPTDILVGTVHVIANPSKAPQEVWAMLNSVNSMCAQTGLAGWMLAGDFNCKPETMIEATGVGGLWPPFSTHQSIADHPIDYILMQPGLYGTLLSVPGIQPGWSPGTIARSDHLLTEYAPPNGPAMQIL